MGGNDTRPDAVSEQVWRKSSRSGSNSDNCVEIVVRIGSVRVRDSKCGGGHTLEFAPDEWRAFVAGFAG